MKYEEIKIGGVFRYGGDVETVISKIDRYRIITTVNSDERATSWSEEGLHFLKPIKEELPKQGLLVSKAGSLVYKLSGGSGYGFPLGRQSMYILSEDWGFYLVPDDFWRPATPEQEKQFIEMLWKECEKLGLFEDTKIECHAYGTMSHDINDGTWGRCVSTALEVHNKNGQIFYKGKFATPLKEETLNLLVVDLVDYIKEETESGVIILTPIKK